MEAVRFDNVKYSYREDGENYAVNGVTLSIEEGEFVAVLGRNGSGKSTLAKMINVLLTPTEGRVQVFGMDTADDKLVYSIRRNTGMVFQNPDNQMVYSIVEDDIAFGPENLGVPRKEMAERIDFALEAVGMQSFRTATSSRLSGGQKQRIAIAGVLALLPKIMILDESTAMLDPRGAAGGDGDRPPPQQGTGDDGHPHHPFHGRGAAGGPRRRHAPRRSGDGRRAERDLRPQRRAGSVQPHAAGRGVYL